MEEFMSAESKKALNQLALEMGVKLLERLPSYLEPEKLLQMASEVLGEETAKQIRDILEDSDSGPMAGLIDKLYQDLDGEKIIETISKPLAEQLASWLQEENLSSLIAAIVQELDFEVLSENIASKIAERIQLSET
jgi:hypothetical protein